MQCIKACPHLMKRGLKIRPHCERIEKTEATTYVQRNKQVDEALQKHGGEGELETRAHRTTESDPESSTQFTRQ